MIATVAAPYQPHFAPVRGPSCLPDAESFAALGAIHRSKFVVRPRFNHHLTPDTIATTRPTLPHAIC